MRRKQIIKGKKLFCSEYTQNDHTWFLFENEEAESDVVCHLEFKLDGFLLEDAPEEEPNRWTVQIEAGSRQLRHLIPAPVEEKKAAPGGRGMMGGFNPMAGLIDDYAAAARSFSYKVSAEWQKRPSDEEY